MSSSKKSTPKQEITSTEDLARYLNLSQWTVSRAINNHTDISEKTRQRVLKAMDEVGFTPNVFARGLRGRSARMIGISFARLNVPVLDQKIFELQEFFRSKQYQCLLETTMHDLDVEVRGIKAFMRIHVDGIVLVQSGLSVKKMKSLLGDVPCVLVDPVHVHNRATVFLDRAVAQRQLLEHLLELGHRQIALLGFDDEDNWRWPPLVQCAKDQGLDPQKIFVSLAKKKSDETNVEAGARMALDAVKQSSSQPTALMCLDDQVAVGAVQALQQAGYSVPEDFSVTGFNNQDIARFIYPRLTTVEQHPESMMNTAGELLLAQVDAADSIKKKRESIRIEPTVLIGESTGPANV